MTKVNTYVAWYNSIKQYYGGTTAVDGHGAESKFQYSGPQTSSNDAKVGAGPLLFNFDGRKAGVAPVSLWARTYRLFGEQDLEGSESYDFASTGFAAGIDLSWCNTYATWYNDVLFGLSAGYGKPEADYKKTQ